MNVQERELVTATDVTRRELVIVVGGGTINNAPFNERRMGIERRGENDAPEFFHVARALIIAEPPRKFRKLQDYFKELIPLAEQHGLVIRILVHSDAEVAQISSIQEARKKQTGEGWRVETFYAANTADVAETIARSYVGPKQTAKPILTSASHGLSKQKRILLARAFYDCSRVALDPLYGGKASEGVFLAHAWIAGVLPIRRPLPFFVKFAGVSAIERERQNYRAWVDPYIPFQLRPNINHRRCVRGSTLSALVGNFVEGAIPLRDALRKGLAHGVLFSLFEVTLKGLRSQPFGNNADKSAAGLDVFVRERADINRLEKDYPERVKLANSYGLKMTPPEMEKRLSEAAAKLSFWYSPMHGDLHDGNVMVRRSDAIVIDFGNINWGPLTADPAALEVGLAFRTDNGDTATFKQWRTFIDKAYDCVPCIRPPNPEPDPTPFSWLHRAVREVRHVLFGCDCVDKEAAVVLSAYLMRFARLPIEDVRTKELRTLAGRRHAYALVIAARILQTIHQLQ